ncbi:DUF4123 domain-containing protein [Alkalilimnicola ehrlichii MLHE-1]|uniref:DUF4123 domain-containing protein n=1 Tax=Alkalilimnicola ehrlichii (strain ATCC BAA-1101 / DSM 17681 / MLHE-1) TaxID=187272 RepID=Q0ACN7_ALKEH|nr:DUF4123 domain-containing protein [Alkalilimnicola ehrlichii]ABI55400.1 conserved hypothetical protein [Alkalilimnicola ehrlichii MLHE-1]
MTTGALPNSAPPSAAALGDGKHYLLLDGIALEPLERWLYEHLDTPVYEPLYLHTPLEACRKLSPCLVALEPGSLVWERFLEQGAVESWGWLMASDASLEELAAHLRWLLFVEHPLEGEKILRLASAQVVHCLLEAEPEPSQSPLLGVIGALWLPIAEDDGITWRHLTNTQGEPVRHRKRFRLQPAHLESLSRIAWQRFAGELAQHLQAFFAHGPLISECGTAGMAARRVIDTTRELGFTGRRAHYYMANILGAYGPAALDEQRMPDLARHVTQTSGTPMERLKAAATEARRLASRESKA